MEREPVKPWPCSAGCDPRNILIQRRDKGEGSVSDYIYQCATCQRATPVLPKEQAVEFWNKNYGKKPGG